MSADKGEKPHPEQRGTTEPFVVGVKQPMQH